MIPVTTAGPVNAKVTQDIFQISLIGLYFFSRPSSHTTPLNQDTRNSAGGCIIIRATGFHIGAYHIRNVHVLRHFSGNLDDFFFSFSRIIYKRRQIFIFISAVKINIIICHTVQFFFYGTGESLCSCSLFISRELPVQIFPVVQTETSCPLLEFFRTDHFYDHYCSCDFFHF